MPNDRNIRCCDDPKWLQIGTCFFLNAFTALKRIAQAIIPSIGSSEILTSSYRVNFLIFLIIVSSEIFTGSNLTHALANFNLKSKTPSDLSKATLTNPCHLCQIMAGMLRLISLASMSFMFITSLLFIYRYASYK